MGGIDFGPQAEVDLTGHIIRWFDYWLKDIDNGVEVEPAVRYFCMGAGAWRTASTWPPEGWARQSITCTARARRSVR